MHSYSAHFLAFLALTLLCGGWVGLNPKPLRKQSSELKQGQSGTYYQLSDDERKELVWMAKAANAAYKKEVIPLGYRPFTFEEWNKCANGCSELTYSENGYFTVGSGLRGRLMVHINSEQRVVLALAGCEGEKGLLATLTSPDFLKDAGQCIGHYFTCTASQYQQVHRLLDGVLTSKSRSQLWIVGHSLGGSLTTYLALNIPESRTNVKCATFNGYGLSPFFDVSGGDASLAAKRLRNVYCDGDVVFKIPAKHFGASYSIACPGDWLQQHFMDNLIRVMIANRTGWAGM